MQKSNKVNSILVIFFFIVWTCCFFKADAAPVASSPEGGSNVAVPPSCPAGQVTHSGECCQGANSNNVGSRCCPTGIPLAFGSTTECCQDYQTYFYSGACHVCPSNQVQRTGVSSGTVAQRCCPTGIPLAFGSTTECCGAPAIYFYNGTCHVCPEATPYLYPTDNLTYQNLGWDGECRRCPETAPWDFNETCSNCPKTEPVLSEGHCCPTGQVYNASIGSCAAPCVFNFRTIEIVGVGRGNIDKLTTTVKTPSCLVDFVTKSRAHCSTYPDYLIDDCVIYEFMSKFVPTEQAVNQYNVTTQIYFNNSCNVVPKPTDTSLLCDAGFYESFISPIVLLWDQSSRVEDLSEDVRLVNFPIDPNQGNKLVEWKASAKAPLLVYDPTGEGKITSGYQLFGNWTFGPKKVASLKGTENAGKLWNNGFDALASLDINGDGEVSGAELEPLSLWFDDNRNGVSEVGEVRRVSSVGVTKLFYKGYENNDTANAVVLKVGFERELAGKSEQGTMVDWFSETVSSELEYTQKAMITSAFNKVENNISKKDRPEIAIEESELLAYKKGAELVEGFWEWNPSSDNNPVKGGRFIISNKKDGTISGLTMIELGIESSFGATSIGSVKGFNGKAKLEADGSVSVTFDLKDKSGTYLTSTAKLSSGSDSMNGTSKGIVKSSAAKTEISYTWVATKLK